MACNLQKAGGMGHYLTRLMRNNKDTRVLLATEPCLLNNSSKFYGTRQGDEGIHLLDDARGAERLTVEAAVLR